jgi:hypothetical protein
MTTLLAGRSGKPFTVHTKLLKDNSQYFRDPSNFPSGKLDSLAFPHLDEFSVALFVRYLYGAHLNMPTDFHSMQHYISLYCLAVKFQVQKLADEVTDLVRTYYREKNMTAPPFRLNYIYEHTPEPCAMRRFLVATAAYRVLHQGGLSNVMKDLIEAGGQLAVDLTDQMARMHRDRVPDPRVGLNCAYHDHDMQGGCYFPVSKGVTQMGVDGMENEKQAKI